MLSNGEVARFSKLYYQDIFLFCRSRLRLEEDAWDVTQCVFLELQKNREILVDQHIRAWLYSTAHNKILEMYRSAEKEPLPLDEEQLDAQDCSVDSLMEDCMISDDDIEKYRQKILKMLTPKERELFQKIYQQHQTIKETAEEFQISESALAVRLVRLRKKVRDNIQIIWMVLCFIIVKINKL